METNEIQSSHISFNLNAVTVMSFHSMDFSFPNGYPCAEEIWACIICRRWM